jgi:hypothetical protein
VRSDSKDAGFIPHHQGKTSGGLLAFYEKKDPFACFLLNKSPVIEQ